MRYVWCGLAMVLLFGVGSLVPAADDASDDDEKIVKLEDLLRTIQENHAAADERYAGQRLKVSGRAVSIERFRPGDKETPVQYVLRLESAPPRDPGGGNFGGGQSPRLTFIFDVKQRGGLAEINRGDTVVIEALCPEELQADINQFSFSEGKLPRITPAPMPAAPAVGPGAPTTPAAEDPFGAAPAFPPMAVPLPRPR